PPAPSSSPAPSTPVLSPLSLHDALPISPKPACFAPLAKAAASAGVRWAERMWASKGMSRAFSWAQAPLTTGQSLSEPMITATLRSEEHTSELQSRFDLVCRLLLEKKKKQ